jgi:putative tryptophan/tyrosine transport system substrate-binding protein
MRRREFIGAIGGSLAALPILVRAQQSAMPVIGFLCSASAAGFGPQLEGFRKGGEPRNPQRQV